MELMEQEETHILTLIMEVISEDMFKKEKESSKQDHFPHKETQELNLIMLKENHFIILEMDQEEIVTLCNFLK